MPTKTAVKLLVQSTLVKIRKKPTASCDSFDKTIQMLRPFYFF